MSAQPAVAVPRAERRIDPVLLLAYIVMAAILAALVIFASTEVDEILDLSHVVVTMFGGRVVATRSRAEVTTEKLSADMTMSRERVATAAADEEGLRA